MTIPPRLADLLPGDSPLIIGVSGGPDSLCLLHLALQMPSLRITVAHFNHRLRPEAEREAGFVQELAGRLGLPFVTGSAEVGNFASENGLSIEEAARLLRYRFLFDQARSLHAGAVAVGHTADDQAETVLMHLLRGAGLAGLKGMTGRSLPNEFDREIPLVRPILHLWRRETEDYCRAHDLHPLYDPSNADEIYFRNRLRHSLIPELENYNPHIKQTLVRTARALAGDYEALAEVVESTWPTAVVDEGPGYVTFSQPVMAGLSAGLRRNIFRRGMEMLMPAMRSLDFASLQRAADFAAAASPSGSPSPARRVDLIEGLVLHREASRLILATIQADLPGSDHWPLIEGLHELQLNSRVDLNGTVSLSATEEDIASGREFTGESGNSFVAWLDADRTGERFTVRTRRPGDRICPLGMDGHSLKLSDLLINVKLPGRARDGWPLVLAGEEIVWVPGVRLAHPFRITGATKRAVRLEVNKK